MHTNTVKTAWLGTKNYQDTWDAMKQFTDHRSAETPDEIWFLEHEPVFTQGQSGKAEHILNAGNIPVVQTDRGGQVTYHGPGQLMAYTLIDLRRKKMNIRELVSKLEQTVVDYLASQQIKAAAKADAPGVYVDERKICSIGLRVRRGCAFHGIAFNVNMDLSPFTQINPCGYSDLKMTQLAELGGTEKVRQASEEITPYLVANLGYNGSQNK